MRKPRSWLRDSDARKSGRWGPYRQASPSPARHRPGARSARWERCLSIPSQTDWRETMKRHSPTARLALVVLAVLGLAGPAAAGEQVPFKGSLEGTVTRSDPPPPIHVNATATGTATQLGLFSLEIPYVVTPPIGHGFYDFVAANGDS